jgi:predicted ATPase/class 3 adenylate cyclase
MNDASRTLQGALQGERKRVTVMFADLSGFTAMTEHRDAEEVVLLVNTCLAHLSECVYRYDGTIDKYIGDALMALFGAPRTHEDDPERAIRAALDMQEALIAFKTNPPLPLSGPLDVHIGIATGNVIAGQIGTERHQAYTVMGSAANLAARLVDLADRGQIFVCEDTYRLTRHLFSARELEPFTIKGMSDPTRVYEMLGARRQPGVGRGVGGPNKPLVGRHAEVYRLSLAVDHLRRGRGGIVIVEGDAGIGKSRLIAEVKTRAQTVATGVRWLEGRGLSYGDSRSYHLLAGVLRDYLGVHDADSESHILARLADTCHDLFDSRADSILPYLGIVLGVRLPEEMTRHIPQTGPKLLQQRVVTAVGEWAMAVAERQPLVLAFDDLHWADPNSIALIEHFMSLCGSHPILVLCVNRLDRESAFWTVRQRAELSFPGHLMLVQLAPLSDNDTLTLINSLLNLDYMPGEIEYAILSRAEGNPLFVEEMLRHFIEEGALIETGGAWRAALPVTVAGVPDTLQGMLTARIDRLDDATKRVLQAAAVIGRTFLRSVLVRVVGEPDALDTSLTQLQRAELIRAYGSDPEPRFSFKHMLTQEVTYQSLLTHQRTLYHQRVADALARVFWERGDDQAGAGLIAAHYERAGAWARALRYLERAGDAARAGFANREAIDHYTRALQVAARLPGTDVARQCLALHQKRGDLLAALGDANAALGDYEEVVRRSQLACDQQSELRALNQIGTLQAELHAGSKVNGYFQRALDLAVAIGDQAGAAESLNRLGESCLRSGRVKEGRRRHRQALEIAQRLGDRALVAASLEGLSQADLMWGQLRAGLTKIERVIDLRRRLVDRAGLLNALQSQAALGFWSGDYQGVADACTEGFDLAGTLGELPIVALLHTWFAACRLGAGDLQPVMHHLECALSVAGRLDHAIGLIQARLWFAYYYLALGRVPEARMMVDAALDQLAAVNSKSLAAQVRTCEGVVLLHQGACDCAFEVLAEVELLAAETGSCAICLPARFERARAALALERWDLAASILREIVGTAELSAFSEYQMRARWLNGQLRLQQGEHHEALTWLEDARARAEALGARLTLWQIESVLGDAYQRLGRAPEAGSAFRRGWATLQSIVAGLPDHTARRHLLATPDAANLQAKAQLFGQ